MRMCNTDVIIARPRILDPGRHNLMYKLYRCLPGRPLEITLISSLNSNFTDYCRYESLTTNLAVQEIELPLFFFNKALVWSEDKILNVNHFNGFLSLFPKACSCSQGLIQIWVGDFWSCISQDPSTMTSAEMPFPISFLVVNLCRLSLSHTSFLNLGSHQLYHYLR